MKILGISAYFHDSAAAIVVNGEIIAAAQEERFTRKKHTADFPRESIEFCLRQANIHLGELDAIVFYDKPFLKFERLLETYMAFAPKGFVSFLKALPVWLQDKLFLKYRIRKELGKINGFDKGKLKLLFTEHHLSHAASAFFASNYKNSAILTIDGVGEWCTTSIGVGNENGIEFVKEMRFPHSLGLLYSAFTYYLGFKVNSGEYKLMGLAPYGQSEAKETLGFIEKIKTNLVDIKEDGSVFLHQTYFNYAVGLTMTNNKKWEGLFGFKRRSEQDEITQQHCNLALAIQMVTEEAVILLAKEAKRLTNAENLCMAGGVALNCVANNKLLQTNLFKRIYVQPAAGDAGGALGAALAAQYIYFSQPRMIDAGFDRMKGSYLGPDAASEDIEKMCRHYRASYKQMHNSDALCRSIADYIADGKIIGWFQGRMEFGPRALGNRSILADPRNEEMQKKLNLKIKYRESFRPFAPAVIQEKAHLFFDTAEQKFPYMLFTSQVGQHIRSDVSPDYKVKTMWEKLYSKRSSLQAITHVDFSARVQTVSKSTNPLFHALISEFEQITGIPVLINTSFNVRGEPIVCTPEDAYRCFMATDMDVLVINNFVFLKTDQPDFDNKSKWRTNFEMD